MPDNRFFYFAYGSNLLRQRLAARCPSLHFVCSAYLADHCLTFNQRSQDGSGKGAMESARGQQLPGVVWSLAATDLPALDAAEGAGQAYQRETVNIVTDKHHLSAVTYRPLQLADRPKPFDWYLALVIAGATQARLPATHVQMLYNIQHQPDHQPHLTGGDLGESALKAARLSCILEKLRSP